MQMLHEHADAVPEVRDQARRAWEEMLGREVATKNNLVLLKKELDEEVITELARLQARLRCLVELLMKNVEGLRGKG